MQTWCSSLPSRLARPPVPATLATHTALYSEPLVPSTWNNRVRYHARQIGVLLRRNSDRKPADTFWHNVLTSGVGVVISSRDRRLHCGATRSQFISANKPVLSNPCCDLDLNRGMPPKAAPQSLRPWVGPKVGVQRAHSSSLKVRVGRSPFADIVVFASAHVTLHTRLSKGICPPGIRRLPSEPRACRRLLPPMPSSTDRSACGRLGQRLMMPMPSKNAVVALRACCARTLE